MTGSYSVVVAPSARAQASRIAEWWQSNREKAPDLFTQELEAALVRVATTPTSFPV